MTNSQPSTTKLYRLLVERGISQASLARKMRVQRQAIGIWVRADEPCPRGRQAQLGIHLGIPTEIGSYFDRDGFAI